MLLFPAMRCWTVVPSVLLALAVVLRGSAQVDGNGDFKLKVAVDEVVVTFHAADAQGLPVNDLKLSDIELLDNDKPPQRVLVFDSMVDYPIRAGILMDTSESMAQGIAANRAVAVAYARRVLRRKTDEAFVVDFGYVSNIRQNWSGDSAALSTAVRGIVAGRANPLGGTALFDALFRACFYQFGKVDHAASGNFILLFSDGEDNASHTSLADAVDACQKANTAIYAFRGPAQESSMGPGALAELAAQTGGRVFHLDDTEAGIYDDLRVIDADLRDQYRIVYRPSELKHDGSFHEIELRVPDRVTSIHVRTGYYAPSR
jgi:VWFA-related protein